MAVVAAGTITFDTTKIDSGVKGITFTKTANLEDITTFDTVGLWLEYIATSKTWNGTIDALWDVGNTAEVGDSGTLTATITDGPTISGTVIIRDMGNPVMKNGVLMQSYAFQGSGAPTYA
ncbi:MAG: hypothetical protein WC657_09165 [Candidatus Paceibacterota bacterium]|jgi:predicted secreted protein